MNSRMTVNEAATIAVIVVAALSVFLSIKSVLADDVPAPKTFTTVYR